MPQEANPKSMDLPIATHVGRRGANLEHSVRFFKGSAVGKKVFKRQGPSTDFTHLFSTVRIKGDTSF